VTYVAGDPNHAISSKPYIAFLQHLCTLILLQHLYHSAGLCGGRQLRVKTMAEDNDKQEEPPEPEGQSLYAEEDGEDENNPDPNEFDERPAECAPFGPTPYFELVSDFFEKMQDMRGKRTAKGAKGSAEKKRALVQHMFNVTYTLLTIQPYTE
jgi:hypothetical protein